MGCRSGASLLGIGLRSAAADRYVSFDTRCRRRRRNSLHSTRSVFWSCAFATAVGGCAAVSWWFAARHLRLPMVVSVDRQYQHWNTTFPAVTICGAQRLNDTAFERFMHR